MARGRPKKAANEQLIKQVLLEAAAAVLSEKSYQAMSIREIAEKAETNSAMISYYFGGKSGLVAALFTSSMEGVLSLADIDNEFARLKPKNRTKSLFRLFVKIIASNPWMFRMIVDDLLNQNPEIRSIMVKTIAGSSEQILTKFIAIQIRDGYFKKSIDRSLVKVSLLSLLAFPFLATPILKEAYNVDMASIDTNKWIKHSVKLFETGLRKN